MILKVKKSRTPSQKFTVGGIEICKFPAPLPGKTSKLPVYTFRQEHLYATITVSRPLNFHVNIHDHRLLDDSEWTHEPYAFAYVLQRLHQYMYFSPDRLQPPEGHESEE